MVSDLSVRWTGAGSIFPRTLRRLHSNSRPPKSDVCGRAEEGVVTGPAASSSRAATDRRRSTRARIHTHTHKYTQQSKVTQHVSEIMRKVRACFQSAGKDVGPEQCQHPCTPSASPRSRGRDGNRYRTGQSTSVLAPAKRREKVKIMVKIRARNELLPTEDQCCARG